MTDHASFLQAILAQPDDDLPRLIYADWLEEQGDAPRAEFIRVQCELHGMARNDPGRDELRAREIALLAEHGARWRHELPKLAGIVWQDFVRGFPIVQAGSMNALESQGPQLFALSPVQSLLLLEINNTELGRFAEWPLAAHLRTLTLRHVTNATSGLRKLVQSPHLQQLQTLAIDGCLLGDRSLRDVAPDISLPALNVLHLPVNRIGNKGVEAILDSPLAQQLTELSLLRNQVSAPGAYALLKKAQLERFTWLDLRGNDIVEPALSALRERLGPRVLL